ncbi:MAG: radical SAM protein [candidate division Zixibacteria bacterium]|nr:radical SAM protein [candidate division Zixibacteria bacterium]
MKIVLADPPEVKSPWLIANHPNLGILYLISYLRGRVDGTELYYLDAHLNLKEHLRRLETIKPDIYGLSFSVMREKDAFKTIEAVKERFQHLPIVCGGPYPTVMAEEILKVLPVDICARGEGEVTMAELVEVFQGKRRLDDVAGIAFKREDQVVTTARRGLVSDLDSIPFPAWDMIDFKKYKGNYQYMAKPSTVMTASRGCPFDCVFCANPVWKLSKPWLRLRSPANVCEEIALLYQKGVREISIRSDEFNPVLSWAIETCQEISKLGLKDLFFQGNIRADNVNDDLAREMKKSNFWLIQLGIESGNQRTLDGIGKRITIEQIVQACRLLKKHGIKVYGYIMIYHAWEENGKFCYETPGDVDRTLDFVRRLKKERILDYMSFSTTTPIRGSRLFEIAEHYKMLKGDKEVRDLSEFSIVLPNISEKAMRRSRRKGLLLQTSINLRSGHNCFMDWGKNWHKVKTLLKSI